MGELKQPDLRMRRLAVVMLAVAGMLAVGALYEVGRSIHWWSWLSSVRASEVPSTQPAGSQPTTTQATKKAGPGKKPSKPREVHAAIKKRNIFGKPKPKGHGMALVGVMVDTALFRTRTGQVVGIAEGKSSQGIKVTAINGYEVTIEHEGKSDTMKLHAGGPGGRPPGRGAPPGRRDAMRGRRPTAPVQRTK